MIEFVSKVINKITGASRDNISLKQKLKSLKKKLKDQSKQEWQLIYLVTKLIERHYNNFPLPPEPLRLNVGTSTSPANWWTQGINSSSRVIQIYGEYPEGPLLDWGCGSGRTLCWLQAYPGYQKHYYGCDVDKDSVDWLMEGGHHVALCHDAPPLPYPDEMFVGIFSFSVLTHIPPEKHRIWYEELWRVLKPGGRLYITTLGASKITAIPDK